MKRMILLVPLAALGCAVPTARDVSKAVGKPVTVQYTDEFEGSIIENGRITVYLHPYWKWEPICYHWGAVAGLAAQAAGANPDTVAERIGIPCFAMWDGDPETSKREATRQQAKLEAYLPKNSPWQDCAPGWPTHLYRR